MKFLFPVFIIFFTFICAITGLTASTNDIVLYYSFDEGRGDEVIDGSGNGLDGDISGDPEWIEGVFGGALEFKGIVDEYIQITDVLPIGSGNNTVAMWIKIPTNAAGRVGILLGNYPDAPNSNWEIHDDGQMRIWWNHGSPDLYGTTDIRDDEWHHLTFIREAGAGYSMYLDGEVEMAPGDAAGNNINFTTKHRVGGDNRGPNSPWLQASIDDLVIFDRVLTEEEINKLVKNEFNPNTINGSVLYYPLNEGQGEFINDESGSGRDGNISGNPEWAEGVFSTGLKFTGKVDEYIQISEILPIGSSSNTVALWIKIPRNAAGRVGNILGCYPDAPNSNWEIHDDGQMRIWWNNGSPDLYGTTDLRDDEWHHLTFIRDKESGRFRMYIDGKLEKLPGTAGGAELEFTTLHRIGGDNRGANSPWLQAAIDDLVIYNQALTKNEIQTIINQPAISPGAVRPDDKLIDTWGNIKLK
jgi:hypothetical protein